MKLPFTIERSFRSPLSYYEIYDELDNLKSIKLGGGLRIDKFSSDFIENIFFIQRYTNGVDAFLEIYPLIRGEIVGQNPTRINLKLTPDYFSIIFFTTFAVIFLIAGIFVQDWTINDVRRSPTFFERLLITGAGCGVPVIMCYVYHIRPIKKAEKWVIKKLKLVNEGQDQQSVYKI